MQRWVGVAVGVGVGVGVGWDVVGFELGGVGGLVWVGVEAGFVAARVGVTPEGALLVAVRVGASGASTVVRPDGVPVAGSTPPVGVGVGAA